MSDDIESALEQVEVRQRLNKTWSLTFPPAGPQSFSDQVFGPGRTVSICTTTSPEKKATKASFHTGFSGAEFTSTQIRLVARLCEIVADALDEETSP